MRSIEFDLFTKIEANARFASKQGMFAKSRRTAMQRAAVRAVLASHFGAVVPSRYVQQGPALVQNRIEVRLTRIAPGRTADAWENLRGALKGVKDEVAAWIGLDDREGAGITWLDPAQEKQGQHVYRVRIEVTDLAPGDPRVVVLAETASEGRKAKARVKRMGSKMYTGTKIAKVSQSGKWSKPGRGSVLVHHADEAARGASSAARAKADALFTKLTGQAPMLPKREDECRCDGVLHFKGAIGCEHRKPTALDLRDAAEGLGLGPGSERASDAPKRLQTKGSLLEPNRHREAAQAECDRANAPLPVVVDAQGIERLRAFGKAHPKGYTPPRDPGEERPARDLAPCTTCSRSVPEPCDPSVPGRMLYGVHVARAIAAGLPVPEDDRASLKPARKSTGERRIVPPAGQAKVLCARCGKPATCWGPFGGSAHEVGACKACCTFNHRCAPIGQCRIEQAPQHPAWVRLPWEQAVCTTCGGRGDDGGGISRGIACEPCDGSGVLGSKVARYPALDAHDQPTARIAVPAAHRARFGHEVTLTRRELRHPRLGTVWLYE